MRVLICGSRTWTDFERVVSEMKTLPTDATIIEGCASRGTMHMICIAEAAGITVKVVR